MIYQNKRELAVAIDEVINKFKSIDFDITDIEGEYRKFIFILIRKGYKLIAYSPTGLVKSVYVPIDDCFCVDEHLQDLHGKCMESIYNSRRFDIEVD